MNATRLKEKVEENLLQDSRLADYPLDVVDNNGIITLVGEVPSEEFSEAAETIVRNTASVVTVINEIVVNKDVERTTGRILPPPTSTTTR